MLCLSQCIVLSILVQLPVLVRSCDYQQCADSCNEKHPDEDAFHTLDHCLQNCHSNGPGCSITIDTPSTNDKQGSYFAHPSRWIPTILGCVVGVGVVCVVIYYARKSWKRRHRYASYGFSKLRSKRNVQSPETELSIVSQ